MRWIPFVILVYAVVLFQATLGRLLVFSTPALGAVGPDLAAMVAVFVAFYARTWADAMLAGWALGLAVDLATAGGPAGETVVGPMALAYSLAAGLLSRVGEAFFLERASTQALLGGLFCLLAHAAWVTLQCLLAGGAAGPADWARAMLQVLATACYSAALMPLAHYLLMKCHRWILTTPVASAARPGR